MSADKKIPKELRHVFQEVRGELDPTMSPEGAFELWMHKNPDRLVAMLQKQALPEASFSPTLRSWFSAPRSVQVKIARTLERASQNPSKEARIAHGGQRLVIQADTSGTWHVLSDRTREPAYYVKRERRVRLKKAPSQMSRADFAREREREDRIKLSDSLRTTRKERGEAIRTQRGECRLSAKRAHDSAKGTRRRVAVARSKEECSTKFRELEEKFERRFADLEAQRPLRARRPAPARAKERRQERDDVVRAELVGRGRRDLLALWEQKKNAPQFRGVTGDHAAVLFLEELHDDHQQVEHEQERQHAKGEELAAQAACAESHERALDGDPLAREYNDKHCNGARPRKLTAAERTGTMFNLPNPGLPNKLVATDHAQPAPQRQTKRREVQQQLAAPGSFAPLAEHGGPQQVLGGLFQPARAPARLAPEPAPMATVAVADDGAEEAELDADGDAGKEGEPSLNAYERKRARRAAGLRARADAVQAAADATYSQARARADIIPFGQPILVGHHSEGRDRRFRDKIHNGFGKAFELQGKAKELRRRADAATTSSTISSDDPDAIEKLRAKIEEKRAFIDRAKDINAVIRAARVRHKNGWQPVARHHLMIKAIPENEIEQYLKKDFTGRVGVPGFALRNANAEIVRLERRIETLQRRDAQPVRAAERIGEAVISEDREANRVQVRFDGVPSKDARSALRGAGFVWAPSSGAWQRKLKDGAFWRAQQVLRGLYPDANKEPARKDAPAPWPPAEPGRMREPEDDDAQDAPLPDEADVGAPF